jgi:3-hydroxybutyryl-CoA dehydrogenase
MSVPENPTITVVGPGRMGIGIVSVLATAGHRVRLLDVKERSESERAEKFEHVRSEVRSHLDFLAEAGRFDGDRQDVVDRIEFTTDMAEALSDADWLFEALPEDPEIKKDLFADASAHVPDECTLATTTSSISLDTLAPAVDDPSRLLITHWLNPAFIVPLVEVAQAEFTDEAAVEATVDLLDSLDKEPVVCRDSPGFVGARIQAAAMNEAVRAWEDEVASAEEIDRALQSGVGLRMASMGLIEFIDLGGVDILYYVDEYLSDELGERFEPPESVVEKMENDELGPKTGKGYYTYEEGDAEKLQTETYRNLLAVRQALEDAEESEQSDSE